MTVERQVKEIFQKVLDIQPEEIEPDARMDEALGVDSTEMVEISVGLKKALGVSLADNELKKTHSFKEIVSIIEAKKK